MDFTFSAVDMKTRGKTRVDFTPAQGESECRREFTCEQLGLALSTLFAYDGCDIAVRGRVTDTTGAARAVSLFFAAPVDGTDLVWHDDIRRQRRISRRYTKSSAANATREAISPIDSCLN